LKEVFEAGFARPIGAKPFEPARPERLSKAETRDDEVQNPYAASHTVRSAPGRSEREAGAIVDLGQDGKIACKGGCHQDIVTI
jgi:hypothetical protein